MEPIARARAPVDDGPDGVADAFAQGQAAWPGVRVPREEFARYLARVVTAGGPPPERAADLYLVCACALRLPRAIEELERVLAVSVKRGVARIDSSASFADLVAQDLRTRLLLGNPPKILDYAGRAPLASWLKTAAVRAALNLRRARGDQAHDSIPCGLVANEAPELELVRARYRADFEAAVKDALATLSERDRAVLRANLGEGKSIDDLAAIHGVGRSTAARWLSAARERLTRATRSLVEARLGLTPSELQSVANAVRADLDVSVVRLLGG